MSRALRIVVVLASFALLTGLSITVVFWIAITIVPSRTAEGYGLMPIGQAALALLAGPILGGIGAALVARRLPRRGEG